MKRFLLAALLLPLLVIGTAYGQPTNFKRGLLPMTPAQKQARATGKWHATDTNYPANWSIVSPKNSILP